MHTCAYMYICIYTCTCPLGVCHACLWRTLVAVTSGNCGFRTGILHVKTFTAATLAGRVLPSGIRALPGSTKGKERRDVMSRCGGFGQLDL